MTYKIAFELQVPCIDDMALWDRQMSFLNKSNRILDDCWYYFFQRWTLYWYFYFVIRVLTKLNSDHLIIHYSDMLWLNKFEIQIRSTPNNRMYIIHCTLCTNNIGYMHVLRVYTVYIWYDINIWPKLLCYYELY